MQEEMKKFSTGALLNFCLGFFGLQFAWQMRIILSGPLTESLGASPFLFGLIWLAGPVTGIVVQPIIGALSDKTQTKFGRRIPYILGGAILAAIGLFLLPNSAFLASLFGALECDPVRLNILIGAIMIWIVMAVVVRKFSKLIAAALLFAIVFGVPDSNTLSQILHGSPEWLGLLIAAIMIWVIDACVNAAQGPYRALIPDNMPKEQHAVANSYLSFAIGLGSVVAAGTAPLLSKVFNYQMSVNAQFYMASLAFLLATIWTCLTIRERKIEAPKTEEKEQKTFIQQLKEFFAISKEVPKICTMQFFAWIGLMSMMIFFTQFMVHTVYNVPDLTQLDEAKKALYAAISADGTNFASTCFAVFNLICFIVAIPIGKLADKFGNKKIHIISLVSMALAYVVMAYAGQISGIIPFEQKYVVMFGMALAGIGWSSTLALPFAMLSKYIKAGTEGSVMGIFNIFIAAPQVLVCTALAAFIDSSKIALEGGLVNNHWEYAFLIGAVMLLLSAFTTAFVKEK